MLKVEAEGESLLLTLWIPEFTAGGFGRKHSNSGQWSTVAAHCERESVREYKLF